MQGDKRAVYVKWQIFHYLRVETRCHEPEGNSFGGYSTNTFHFNGNRKLSHCPFGGHTIIDLLEKLS